MPTEEKIIDSIHICKNRIMLLCAIFLLCYVALSARLLYLSVGNYDSGAEHSDAPYLTRASILDARGIAVATNLITNSIYANPAKMVNKQDAAKKICKIIDATKSHCQKITHNINSNKSFVWIARHAPITQQIKIREAGIPAVYFIKDQKRLYPHSNLLSHVLGYTDTEGKGIAGIEKAMGEDLQNNQDIRLSIDLRLQHVMRSELLDAMAKNQSTGAGGIIVDVKNGKIKAMVSVPDFNPNNTAHYITDVIFNRNTSGVYEMGSTFKAINVAIGLDAKKIKLHDVVDVGRPIKLGKFTIKDYKKIKDKMSITETLQYSSNIGSVKVARKIGVETQKAYFEKLGFTNKALIQLPERASPILPIKWDKITSLAMSYGYGIAITPLHLVTAFTAIANGGRYRPLSLLDDVSYDGVQLFDAKVAKQVIKILQIVVSDGYGKHAIVKGYNVFGKTGTAEQISHNKSKYSHHLNNAYFIGGLPAENPKYVIFIMIEGATKNKYNKYFTTGGMIAAPVAGNVIKKIIGILQ